VTRPGSKSTALLLALCLATATLTGCPKKKEKPVKPPEQLYNDGVSFMAKRKAGAFFNPPDYEKARNAFQEIVYEHPTSRYAPLAELKIADTHYEAGDYQTAADRYERWRKHHVGRPEIPYAIYRTGICYFHLMLSIDRDQTYTRQALDNFRLLLARYPESDFAEAVGEKTRILEARLAEHEMYIAKFYFRHNRWWAAVDRCRALMATYPDAGLDQEAMYYIWKSYRKLKRPALAENTYNQLVEQFPEGKWADRARQKLETETGRRFNR